MNMYGICARQRRATKRLSGDEHKGDLWIVTTRLPPLSAIRAFEAAARHGSFTKAAEELGMTQAAVSYQVKLLEDRLGAPLFLREARRVVLSEAGKRLAPSIKIG